ncbi:unnamed protein product [Ixodes persulcatus]
MTSLRKLSASLILIALSSLKFNQVRAREHVSARSSGRSGGSGAGGGPQAPQPPAPGCLQADTADPGTGGRGCGYHAHKRGESAGERSEAVGAGRPCRCPAARCFAVRAAGWQVEEEVLVEKLQDVGNLNCCHCGHNHYHYCLGCQWLGAHVGEDFCGRPARRAPPAPGRRTRGGPRRLRRGIPDCARGPLRLSASGAPCGSLGSPAPFARDARKLCGLSVRSHNRGSPSSRRCR